jgi:fructose-1,6-bisphosphatase/inositol monophosphatase family enzyme
MPVAIPKSEYASPVMPGGRLDLAVCALLRQVAAEVVMPRFGKLAAGDVLEKTPGEQVTIADRESEELLTAGLARILPAARVVGEEACDASPALLDGIDEGLVWIVDPIDGTANFAAGRAPFGLMTALIEDGDVLAGWIFDPLQDRLCRAFRGQGAFVNGRSLRVPKRTEPIPIASLATQFMAPGDRAALESRAAEAFELRPIPRCAAEHYPRVALGENHVAMFQRILPWDHAAGTLFLTEAGGVARHWDGSAYRIGNDGRGLLVASSRADWEFAYRRIFAAGLPPLYRG